MTIASFPTSSGNGTEPDGQLFLDSSGNLIGATVLGGTGDGTTYKIVDTGGVYASTPTFLADIPNGLNTLENVPILSADANGDLFGLEISGGVHHYGTIVEFPAGGGAPTTVAGFDGSGAGANPGGQLLVDASGNLFGTTAGGGAGGTGGASGAATVFELKNTGGVYATAPIVLTSFGSGITPSGSGNLVEDAAGDLFGTTTSSVFEVQKTGAAYAPPVSLVPFPVGTEIGNLTIDANGDIFGTTVTGGAEADGTIFEIEKTASGYASTATTLASFTPTDGQLTLNHPKTLILDANGDIFGTTDPSSQNSGGVVYEIVKTSIGYQPIPVIVANFSGGAEGVGLGANLVPDASGNLFTTTKTGGTSSDGSVVEITDSGFATTPLPPPSPKAVSDFTGDGTSDVLLQNGGAVVDWIMNNGAYQSGNVLSAGGAAGYNVVGTGDFTGNGVSDVLLQNGGAVVEWLMNNGVYQSGSVLANAGSYNVVGTGDLTGNGTDDVLLQNGGSVVDWIMQNGVYQSGNVLANAGSYSVVGTGDLTGNGTDDVVLQNGSGTIVDWIMNNGVYQSGNVVGAAAGWKVVGTGDFAGNGTDDILLQNGNTIVDWIMQNGKYVSGNVVSANTDGFSVVGTGDYNGDGTSDILLQKGGTVVDWIIKDGQYASGNVLATGLSGWHVPPTG